MKDREKRNGVGLTGQEQKKKLGGQVREEAPLKATRVQLHDDGREVEHER